MPDLSRIGSRRVVASVSGGKDSAALSLWLTEQGIKHDRIFLDTGWEHPDTYAYLRGPLTEALGAITELRASLGFADLARKKRMFPCRTKRFCTQFLKVFPAQAHLNQLVEQGHDVVNAVGIRASESQARSRLPEWEWSDGFDCEVWRPLLAWSEQDVIECHRRHGLAPNPLYLRGHSRVGCYPCVFANKRELRLIAENDPWKIDEIRALEEEIRGISKSGRPSMFSLRKTINVLQAEHESDDCDEDVKYSMQPKEVHVPTGIDEVLEWARTERGGRQCMFFQDAPDAGCMRWGLCETEAP